MTDNYEADDVLLDYETETDEVTPVAASVPVPVVVCEPVIAEQAIPQHPVFRTFVLTSDNPFRQLLTIDPLRVSATIVSLDKNVVLTSSRAQAMTPANLVAALTNPDGAILPTSTTGFSVTTDTVGEVWATAAEYPARVAVYMTRRTA